jgi:SecD/SecF fusion protein
MSQGPVVNHAAIARTVEVLRQRINAVLPGVHVSSAGDKVFMRTATATPSRRAQLLALAGPGRLALYDWEANALAPNGKIVASQLQSQDPRALELSQGSGSVAPGGPGAGSLPLYEAVKLASRQPKSVSVDNSRVGPEYFMFGAPGSAACTTAAAYFGIAPAVLSRCYLSGPAAKLRELTSTLPPAVSASEGEVLAIQQGTVVLQAVPASFALAPGWSDPTARFYVLHDHVALSGNDITNPQQSTNQSRLPSVSFGFTSRGQSEFQNVTARIAHRGDLVSRLGQMLNQHFAIALDTQLITVPYIDFKTNPDGVAGNAGGDITGGLTNASARGLARELRLGAVPIRLELISSGS